MTTSHTINITMDPQTIAALSSQNLCLYAFKAVSTSTSGGEPTVWFSTSNFASSLAIVWQGDYQAYTSSTPIAANAVVMENTVRDISIGQMLVVDSNGGGTVKNGATKTGISLLNQSQSILTAGISEEVNGTTSPMCALPLFANSLDTVVPVQKIFLMIAQSQFDQGTIVEKTIAPGILIDMTNNSNSSAIYNINTGWSASGAQNIPALTDLASVLIEDPNMSQLAANI